MATHHPYGPNGQQVERFIERLRALSPEAWRELESGGNYSIDFDEVRGKANQEANDWLAAASQELEELEAVNGELYFRCLNPVTALALADSLAPHQFALMYARFESLIPVEELGDGLAPQFPLQLAAVYEFASQIERGRYERSDKSYERSPLLVLVSAFAAVAGIVAGLVGGGWPGLLAVFSVVVLFLISLWGQRADSAWTSWWPGA